MQRLIHLIFFCIFCSHLLFPRVVFSRKLTDLGSDPVKIIIIAGQSNAINIHANAKELQEALIDTSVRFYYHCGMPPDRNIPLFSTSDNKWTKLSVQRQVPFLANNEYFFGPEITLINSLKKYSMNIAVIKCAYGGSDLAEDWNCKAAKGNLLYKTMMDQISNACSILEKSGEGHSFAGFFWIQGETDASNQSYAQAYFENLKDFISRIRSDLNSPELPFIISRLPSGQPYTYINLIRSAQEKAANVIPRTKWIDTDSLALDKDRIHFVSSGVQKLGSLMAEAFQNVTASNCKQNAPRLFDGFVLRQNYPNPFNSMTKISYFTPVNIEVKLKVFDLLGREITTLVNEFKSAGTHSVQFNAGSLPGGIYMYRIAAGVYTDSRKLIILK